MRGWAIEFGDEYLPTESFENRVVGIACDGDFPEPDKVLHIISRIPEDAVVVVRESDNVAREVLDAIDREYVAAPLNPWWKRELVAPIEGPLLPGKRRKFEKTIVYDFRSRTRIFDMLYGCTDVIWFKTATSKTDHFDVEYSPRAEVFRIEGGKKKRGKKA